MDKILAAQPLKVPVMLVHSLWDQEDIYGAIAVYKAIKPKDRNDKVFLVMGPWHHGQEIENGSTLGALDFDANTSREFQQQYGFLLIYSVRRLALRRCVQSRSLTPAR